MKKTILIMSLSMLACTAAQAQSEKRAAVQEQSGGATVNPDGTISLQPAEQVTPAKTEPATAPVKADEAQPAPVAQPKAPTTDVKKRKAPAPAPK